MQNTVHKIHNGDKKSKSTSGKGFHFAFVYFNQQMLLHMILLTVI